ncbi:uncharacterized protein LAESUDRAFT_727914 [Laetiporus sulphureus 93-53]|uniref:Uncharacterized protein n=1 Tax=Laetiporus sulphureus 93-53 TaxID=1314785 RepID=A0A165DAI1_9APHY|nr:uncharacterized protein LAESUDRAFT_727914 [Laetiporus sulphureus 93-53]KZT04438.1 hypothetical protein LAESUDRAFT_727914 [Laetiporus sulphureus 93-53]
MENCPAEIWSRIFFLACADGGHTGRSLSHVSRYFRQTSQLAQLHSIAISGVGQLYEFTEMLSRRPSELCMIRHLFVSSQDIPRKRPYAYPEILASLPQEELSKHLIYHLYRPGDEDLIQQLLKRAGHRRSWNKVSILAERRAAFRIVLLRLLRIVAPTLQTLTLYLDTSHQLVLQDVQFPSLVELTLHSKFPIATVFGGPSRSVQPMPKLTRLHVAGDPDCFEVFLGSVPALTHLRLTGVSYLASRIQSAVCAAINAFSADSIHEQSPGQASSDSAIQRQSGSELPPLSCVMIHPCSALRGWQVQNNVVCTLQSMTKRNDKLVLLGIAEFDAPSHYDIAQAKQHWLERVVGDEGCWSTTITPKNASGERWKFEYRHWVA